jgi:membrane protease subunit HflC
MNNNKNLILGGIFAGILWVILNGVYILDQRQYDLILQFGDVIRQDTEPGLKFKVPFLHNALFFDNRIQTLVFAAGDDSEVVSSDQKTMKLNAFAKYRIADPLKFFITVRDENNLRNRMVALMESSIREVIGSTKFNDVLGQKRSLVMDSITNMVKEQLLKFGIEVFEVRINRVALPEKARDAVYARMRTERQKEANEIRATGSEEGQKIRADAEKQRTVMLAEAQKEAATLLGQAEAEAIKTIAAAVGTDLDFFEFYRSLEAYKKSFQSKDTKLVLSTKESFLKYLERKDQAK